MTFREITERKRAEEEREKLIGELRSLEGGVKVRQVVEENWDLQNN